MTAAQQLADMEDRIRAGALNLDDNPHLAEDLTTLRDKVAAEQRIHELRKAGRAEQQELDEAAELQHRRRSAIHEAQQQMRDVPNTIDSAVQYAIDALVELWDVVAASATTHDEAVRALTEARVPYLQTDVGDGKLPSTGEHAGEVDLNNRVAPSYVGGPNLILDGREYVRSAIDPGTWVRYAIREAADHREGMPSRGIAVSSVSLDRAIGNVARPHLPSLD